MTLSAPIIRFDKKGEERISALTDYNSHNVPLLDQEGMARLLLKLDCLQQALRGEKVEA